MPPALITRSTAHAVLRHSLKNDAGVKRCTFNCREQFILRGVHQVPSKRYAAQFGIYQHGAVAVVPAQTQQARFARPCTTQAPSTDSKTRVCAALRAMPSKMSPVRRESGFNARVQRMHAARHHSAHARHQLASCAIAMTHVDVPTTFTTSPSRMLEPIASQCASNAPTGIGIPARNPSFSAHSALDVRRFVAGQILAAHLRAHALQQWIDRDQKAPPAAIRPTWDSTSTCGPLRTRYASARWRS